MVDGAGDMEVAVARHSPELIVCPMLKQRIPESIWSTRRCLVVHPGPMGDRGPSSLDWAIELGARDWGVTVLEANGDFDAGDLWASRTFPMRESGKGSIYRHEVRRTAIDALMEAVRKVLEGGAPEALDEDGARAVGRARPLMKQDVRAIDWQADPTETVLRKVRAAEGHPGVIHEIAGVDCHLFGVQRERGLRGAPGEIIAQRHGAICRATVDGAVWVTHLRRSGPPQLSLRTHLDTEAVTRPKNNSRPIDGRPLSRRIMNAGIPMGRRRAARRLLAGLVLAAGIAAATSSSALAATTATFSSGVLTVSGDGADNSIAISRDAAGRILVNGGAIAVTGGTPTVANTAQIRVIGLGGNDTITLNEANGALPRGEPVRRRRQRRPHRRLGRRPALRPGRQRHAARQGRLRPAVRRRRERHADRRRRRRPGLRPGRQRPHDLEPRRRHRPQRGRRRRRHGRGQRRQRRRAVHRHGQRHPRPLRPPQPGAVRDRHRHLREPRRSTPTAATTRFSATGNLAALIEHHGRRRRGQRHDPRQQRRRRPARRRRQRLRRRQPGQRRRPASAPATTRSSGIPATAATSSRARTAPTRCCSTAATPTRTWRSPPTAAGCASPATSPTITMDLNDVEAIDAQHPRRHRQRSSSTTCPAPTSPTSRADLAASGGGDDGAADNVVVNAHQRRRRRDRHRRRTERAGRRVSRPWSRCPAPSPAATG